MPNPSTLAMQDEENGIVYPTPDNRHAFGLTNRDQFGMEGGGNTFKKFFYLAGPMSGYPAFNFPAFHAASGRLREQGYNVVSPAELDYEEARRKAEESLDGQHDLVLYHECLRRDLRIVLSPNLVGVICLPGWENSSGAQIETYVSNWLDIPLYMYSETDEGIDLTLFERNAALKAAGLEWV